MPCRREWQPTPEFLPGKSHGQRRLAGSCRVHKVRRETWLSAHAPQATLLLERGNSIRLSVLSAGSFFFLPISALLGKKSHSKVMAMAGPHRWLCVSYKNVPPSGSSALPGAFLQSKTYTKECGNTGMRSSAFSSQKSWKLMDVLKFAHLYHLSLQGNPKVCLP